MWKITLADGTIINAKGVNGSYFVTDDSITAETFAGKLNGVKIQAPANIDPQDWEAQNVKHWAELPHQHMKLISILTNCKDGIHFAIGDIPAAELKELSRDAKIEYVAMMAGVDLPE